MVLKGKNEEKCQFSLDFEGNSGNSHFRAMCALYFFIAFGANGNFSALFFAYKQIIFCKINVFITYLCVFTYFLELFSLF